jgi:polyhydroxyalkanoate synthesis regulator phasin
MVIIRDCGTQYNLCRTGIHTAANAWLFPIFESEAFIIFSMACNEFRFRIGTLLSIVQRLLENPLEVLKGVTMKSVFEKGFLAGIGLLSMTRDKAQQLIEELSHEGEVQKGEVKQWVDQLTDRGEEERQALRKLVREEMKKVMDEMGLATKEDIQKLVQKQD